jgi:hypothetical protein
MRHPKTAEVRLDEHKAASFGPAGPRILPFWPSTSRLRSNFVAAEPPGTEDRDQQLRYPRISCGIVFPTLGSADRPPDGSVRQGGSSPGTAAVRRAL